MSQQGGQDGYEKIFSFALALVIIGLGIIYFKKSGQLDALKSALSFLNSGNT